MKIRVKFTIYFKLMFQHVILTTHHLNIGTTLFMIVIMIFGKVCLLHGGIMLQNSTLLIGNKFCVLVFGIIVTLLWGIDVYCISWEKVGIKYINDLLSTEGEFLLLTDIQNKYNVKINFLQYHGMKRAIHEAFSNLLCSSNTTLHNPFQGFIPA